MINMNGDFVTGGQSAGRQTLNIYCNTEIVFSVKWKKYIYISGLHNMFSSSRNNWTYN